MSFLTIAVLISSLVVGSSQLLNCNWCKHDDSSICGSFDMFCQACEMFALPFNTAVQPIVAECSQQENSLGKRALVNIAIDVLVKRGFFTRDEFDGVNIFFCSDLESSSRFTSFGVSGEFAGMAYVDTILIVEQYIRDESFEYFASLLAHEMFHIRQYRFWGLSKFACLYSNEVAEGKGSSSDNVIEGPAYAFGDNVLACLMNRKDCQEP